MFEFDEEKHEYTLDGVVLPSVTQIIAPLNDFSRIAPGVLERKRQIGKAVHKAVELYTANDLEEDSVDELCKGYFAGFLNWADDNKELLLDSTMEKINYHPKLKYAGTPDIDHFECVIDIKTRPYNPITDPLQLSPYKYFGNPKRAGYVLELKADGTYHLQKVPEGQSWGVFRQMLEYHKATLYFNEILKGWRERK